MRKLRKNKIARTVFSILVGAGVYNVFPILGAPFIHSDIEISNIRWTPQSGMFSWFGDWELNASASAFDSVNGFSTESNFAVGQPASVSANVSAGYSSGFAEMIVDSSGEALSPTCAMDISFQTGVFASAFASSSAYREFLITGGEGAVSLTVSFDYLAHLQGTASQANADLRATLSIGSASDTFDLTAFVDGNGIIDQTFSGTMSQILILEYDTFYSTSVFVGSEPSVAESGPGLGLTAAVFLSLVSSWKMKHFTRQLC